MFVLKTLIYLATLLAFAFAQGTQLLAPPPGTTLTPGKSVTVRVGMGGYPQSINVVAIVIGLQHCIGPCSPPNQFMGTSILYQGPYKPTPGQYYADYSVMVPSTFPAGTASLGVINLFMVGASNAPIINYLNETVKVA